MSRTRTARGYRLDPADEYMHAVDDEVTFNESMYVNGFDPDRGFGGWFRIGNRPREGYAEMTVCLYLPDGRVGFMFGRPKITDNAGFAAGGMRVDVVEPFVELHWSYGGELLLLDDPAVLADPRVAFTDSPRRPGRVDLTVRGVSPAFGGEPTEGQQGEATGGEFARGHYEQHVSVTGTVEVGDERHELAGFGLRDHSWGPRTWQAPWWYRWLTANAGPDRGFMVSVIARRDGGRTLGGVLLEGGDYLPIREPRIETEWTGDPACPAKVVVDAVAGDRPLHVEGTVRTLVPLRNRRIGEDGAELVTRIAEGYTEWQWDGVTGYGMSEYLDQMVDGTPAGILDP